MRAHFAKIIFYKNFAKMTLCPKVQFFWPTLHMRCESDRGGDEVHPATFGREEKTGLKLDRRRIYTYSKVNWVFAVFSSSS